MYILKADLLSDRLEQQLAINDFIHATTVGDKLRLPLINEAYINIGNLYFKKLDYKSALKYYNMADTNIALSDESRSIMFNNKAICYNEIEEYALSKTYFEKSMDIEKKISDTVGLTTAYLNLGGLYLQEYNYTSAFRYFKKSLQLAIFKKDDNILENVYYNLSLLYESKGDFAHALNYYRQSDSARARQAEKDKVWELAQVEQKVAVQSKQLQINTLERDALLRQAEIRERSAQRNVVIVIAVALALLAATIFFFLLQKNKANDIILSQKAKLENLGKAKDRLFSIIAHDLRSPMSTMLSKNRQLCNEIEATATPKAGALLRDLRKETEHTHLLLNNLLHWSFTETGNLFILPQPMPLRPCVQQITEELSFAARQKNIAFTISIPGNTIIVMDHNSIRIILRNLIQNAIKFSHTNSQIDISFYNTATAQYISVRDYGIGIPKNIREQLFEMNGEKVRAGTGNEKGSGLGLWLVSYLAQKNNATVVADPDISCGTSMIIQLNTDTHAGT